MILDDEEEEYMSWLEQGNVLMPCCVSLYMTLNNIAFTLNISRWFRMLHIYGNRFLDAFLILVVIVGVI